MSASTFKEYEHFGVRHKKGLTFRERMCAVPRKLNTHKNYLRPYGATYGKTVCSCRDMGYKQQASINHGAQRWRSTIRKAERKSARQRARLEINAEFSLIRLNDFLDYYGLEAA